MATVFVFYKSVGHKWDMRFDAKNLEIATILAEEWIDKMKSESKSFEVIRIEKRDED